MKKNLNTDVNLFIVTHKAFTPPIIDSYIPIQVGKVFSNVDLGYYSDDKGDNIALKNKNYCELTALYWIWKNVSDYKYVGMVHYRRYFSKALFSNNSKYFITKEDIKKYLNKYDIIVPKRFYWGDKNVKKIYSGGSGLDKDLDQTRKSIEKIYPDYLSSFDKILRSNSAYYCNMFVTKKETFEKYSEWLFSILQDVEDSIDISTYSVKEARVFGYISEILLNVWVDKNNLDYKEINIINTDQSFMRKIKTRLKYTYNRIIKS